MNSDIDSQLLIDQSGSSALAAKSLMPAIVGKDARRPPLKSSWEAFQYLMSLPKGTFRESDKITAAFLGTAVLLLASTVMAPPPYSGIIGLAGDMFFGLTIFSYIINRFGVVKLLHAREAVLIWDLMLGAFLLGIFVAVNFSLAMSYIRSSMSIGI